LHLVCSRISSTSFAYTDLDSLGGGSLSFEKGLGAQLTIMNFESLESAIECVKKIRMARTELLELEAESEVWRRLYETLQPIIRLEDVFFLLGKTARFEDGVERMQIFRNADIKLLLRRKK
jgi:hypothetical protein